MELNLNRRIIPRGERILVALSGGADSVALLHGLHGLQTELEIELFAAHYSHGIRKEAAEGETAFIQSLCKSLDVPCHIGCGDVPAYAKANRMGIEEAARTLRYAFLYAKAEELGCEAIAVAHNLGDNAETMLFNLTRGTGLAGLGGIPAVSDRVIRPMLGLSRAEVEAYDRSHGLRWLTDESNFDQTYSRNRIRHTVLPALRQINPDAEGSMARAAENLSLAQDFILQSALGLLACDRELGRIDRRLLRASHPALYHPVLTLLLREVKADGRLLDTRKTEAVMALALGDRASGSIDLGGGIRAVLDYTDLCIENTALMEEEVLDGETELVPGVPLQWNGWEILVGGHEGIPFDRETIEYPIRVRSRRTGDRIAMASGHKNIKKILIDRKIPVKTRDRIPVICDNNKVLLLGDLARDGRSREKSEREAVRISCRRITL